MPPIATATGRKMKEALTPYTDMVFFIHSFRAVPTKVLVFTDPLMRTAKSFSPTPFDQVYWRRTAVSFSSLSYYLFIHSFTIVKVWSDEAQQMKTSPFYFRSIFVVFLMPRFIWYQVAKVDDIIGRCLVAKEKGNKNLIICMKRHVMVLTLTRAGYHIDVRRSDLMAPPNWRV